MRRRITCEFCGRKFRTRRKKLIDTKTCAKCDEDSEHCGAPIPVTSPMYGQLDWTLCREGWLHEVLYRNAEMNGLTCFGLGSLSFIHKSQRGDRFGRWRHKDNEYDMLMVRDVDAGRQHVCIEIKKVADYSLAAQLMRYFLALRDWAGDRGRPPPLMVVVACNYTSRFLEAAGLLSKSGMEIKMFHIGLAYDAFRVSEVCGD